MSDQPANQDATMSENKAGKQPTQETASASNQHAQHEGTGNTRGPAYPPINPNANLEAQFERTFHEMINLSESNQPEEAEKVAYILLSHGNLPVLYRAFAHMILAHGLEDCLLHAEKAVAIAEWGLSKYGDDKGVGSELLATTQRVLGEVQARVVQEKEEMKDVETHAPEGSAAGKSAHGQGQEAAGDQLQVGHHTAAVSQVSIKGDHSDDTK